MAEPRPRWLYLIVAGYLVLALGMSAALFGMQVQADRIESLQSQDCTRRQEARVAVRSIGLTLRTLVLSTSDNRRDLTAVPGYSSLDPAVREFFATLSSPGGPSDWQVAALTTVDDALGKLPDLTCP